VTYTIKLKSKPPRIFVGIPTGRSKEYCMYYMLGALRNLRYSPLFFKVVFAVTDKGEPQDKQFIENLRGLLKHADFMFETEVIMTQPTQRDAEKWGVFAAVILNVQALRRKFLSEPYDYFWLLGGDNPPPPDTLNRLLKLKTDIAAALVYQRPMKDFYERGAYPLVYRHVWHLKHLENNGLNQEQKRLLTLAWVNLGFMRLLAYEKNWRRYKVLRDVGFGDGCCLFKRTVFETLEYKGAPKGYQSNDIQFQQEAMAAGFHTAVDMKLHCPHFCVDGKAY
jgi:hypothetical protein